MGKHLIFVSCGQLTEHEKTLGVLLNGLIDGTPGFEAYFAEAVRAFEAPVRNVFDALCRGAGAVVILHDRGMVVGPKGEELGRRSSVCINQELAILAYRHFSEDKHIPVLAFADRKVKIEGAMTSLIVNPGPLGAAEDVVSAVRSWLAERQFGGTSHEAFQQKWAQLSESARGVVAGLLDEGGYSVKETAVRHALMRLFNTRPDQASEAVRNSKLEFMKTDVVKLIQNIYSGDELSVHPTWKFALRREIAKWSGGQGRGNDVA